MNYMICGRAHTLWAPMVQEIRCLYAAGEEISVLVPEQYTFQAERDLMRDLHVPGFFRLDVLSPSRLEYRVFDALGADARVRIDERGRAMTVARALKKAQGDLRFYESSHDRPGLIRKMAALISSFKTAGVTPEQLQALAEHFGDRGIGYKFGDSAAVMVRYQQLLEGRFADEEDIRREMLLRLERGGLMANRHVFVYGFDLITQQMHDLLLLLSQRCPGLWVYMVSVPAQADDGVSFDPVRQSVQRVLDAWDLRKIPRAFKWLTDVRQDIPAEIAHLERHLLGVAQPAYEGGVSAIRLYAASTPFAEVQHLAALVWHALQEGARAEDIYVLCGNLPEYRGLILSAFDTWGIPLHVSEKLPLTAHRLVRHLLAALRCAADGYRPEDVAEILKCGFTALNREDAWELEDYAISHGIRGGHWRKPFSRGKDDVRTAAEQLRLQLIPPLERLREGLLAADSAAASLQALESYLAQEAFYDKAVALEHALYAGGLLLPAAQVPQVIDRLKEMFAQMTALMADERIPLKYFALWLQSGLQEEEVGSLPPRSGRVEIGQLGHVILPYPKVVCLLGLNDGVLEAADDELLTLGERLLALEQLRVPLGLDLPGKQQLKLLDFYKALSAPSAKLYLSYALANEEGGALQPLAQLTGIRRMYPHLREEGGVLSEHASGPPPAAPGPALDALALRLQGGHLDAQWAQAWAWLNYDPAWRDAAMALRQSFGAPQPQPPLPGPMAKQLYPPDAVSVSRLETFAECPFKHFVDYGLRPQPKREWLVEPVDTGSFYHSALEGFIRLALRHPQWPHVEDAISDKLLEAAVAPLIAAWENSPFMDSARQRHTSNSYVALTRHMARMLTAGAQHSAFRPVSAEMRFGGEGEAGPLSLQIADGRIIRLRGTIDRIDRLQDEVGDFVRVIDYKSSGSGMVWERIWQGSQLQLLIYLKRALMMYPQSRAAGALYQVMTDPLINTGDENLVAAEIIKAHRLNGLVLEDPHVVRMMDLDGDFNLPKLLKQDGQPMAHSSLISQGEMELLTTHAVRRVGQLSQRIYAGEIARSPAIDDKRHKPCDYCSYRGICRIDFSREGALRALHKMDREQLLARIRQDI